MYKTVFIYYGVLMLGRVDDVEKFVIMANSENGNIPFYHYYGIWLDSSACRFCPFFIDVNREYVYGLCQENCAMMYSMRYLQ